MIKNLFDGNALLGLPIATLLFFFLTFVGVVAWVYLRRRPSHYDEVANLPLDDDPR